MKSVKYLVILGILIIFEGCVTLYKPNAINSPMLIEKGELNSTATMGLSGVGLYNLQAAYAVSDHVGVMIDGMYHSRQSGSSDSAAETLNMYLGEVGAGYFNKLGTHENILFQCYGGAGYGYTIDRMKHSYQPYPEVSAKYLNLFVQPGLFFHDNFFDLAFDVRTNYVHLFHIHGYLYEQFEWWNTDFVFHSDTIIDFVNLEPTLTFKVGGQKLKGVIQLGFTLPVINSDAYFHVNTSSMLIAPLVKFSFGINYTFGRK